MGFDQRAAWRPYRTYGSICYLIFLSFQTNDTDDGVHDDDDSGVEHFASTDLFLGALLDDHPVWI